MSWVRLMATPKGDIARKIEFVKREIEKEDKNAGISKHSA